MKKFKLLSLLVIGLILSTNLGYAQSIEENVTQDKEQNYWADMKIQEAINAKIIQEAESFRPDENITRYEFVLMMNKALKLEKQKEKTFIDLEKGSTKELEMLKAVEQGYIVGYEDNTIRPDANLLRQEAAAMVVSALKLADDKETAKKYLDNRMIDEYAQGKVGAVSVAKIMGGTPEGNFEPKGNITKAEALVVALNVQKRSIPVLTIDKDKTVIQNQTVQGDIVISEKLGNGSVTLKNVNVLGSLIIKGGGKNSIHLEDSNFDKIVVNDENNQVRVSFEGNTKTQHIAMESGGNLDSKNFQGEIKLISVNENNNQNAVIEVKVPISILELSKNTVMAIKVQAPVQKIEIKDAQGQGTSMPTIEIAKGIIVNEIVANSPVKIEGEGKILELKANVPGIKTTIDPDKTTTSPGVEPPQKVETEDPPQKDTSEKDSYDKSVTSATMHIDSKDITVEAVNGVINFDLRAVEGNIIGLTLESNDKNTYTVTSVSSPKLGNKTGIWTCETKGKQNMSIFIDYAKDALELGGATNVDKMPTAVIRGYAGKGTYIATGKINEKTLIIEIIL